MTFSAAESLPVLAPDPLVAGLVLGQSASLRRLSRCADERRWAAYFGRPRFAPAPSGPPRSLAPRMADPQVLPTTAEDAFGFQ